MTYVSVLVASSTTYKQLVSIDDIPIVLGAPAINPPPEENSYVWTATAAAREVLKAKDLQKVEGMRNRRLLTEIDRLKMKIHGSPKAMKKKLNLKIEAHYKKKYVTKSMLPGSMVEVYVQQQHDFRAAASGNNANPAATASPKKANNVSAAAASASTDNADLAAQPSPAASVGRSPGRPRIPSQSRGNV